MRDDLTGQVNHKFQYLFEPALARFGWSKPSSVVGFQLEAIYAVRVYSVWARDLVFGAWNFHYAGNFCLISQLLG
jgi:hypothetical protein